MEKLFSKCGTRCDLCLIYRPNVEKEDRRADCGYCDQYPCDIFSAEPTPEEVQQKVEVEKKWTWEDEKLMEAYACRRYMDEFKRNR